MAEWKKLMMEHDAAPYGLVYSGTSATEYTGPWRIVNRTRKTVTIASASNVDAGPRFNGKRYQYRWRGFGYVRKGQSLYCDA